MVKLNVSTFLYGADTLKLNGQSGNYMNNQSAINQNAKAWFHSLQLQSGVTHSDQSPIKVLNLNGKTLFHVNAESQPPLAIPLAFVNGPFVVGGTQQFFQTSNLTFLVMLLLQMVRSVIIRAGFRRH